MGTAHVFHNFGYQLLVLFFRVLLIEDAILLALYANTAKAVIGVIAEAAVDHVVHLRECVVAKQTSCDVVACDAAVIEQFSVTTFMDIHTVLERHKALSDVPTVPEIF